MNVVHLAPPETGPCGVCGALSDVHSTTTLEWVDQPTQIKVGRCCVTELKRADHALLWHGRRFGITDPPSPISP
jgi:hypothetical protein